MSVIPVRICKRDSHIVRFIAVAVTVGIEEIMKKEQLQDGENHYQFYDYQRPELSPHSH